MASITFYLVRELYGKHFVYSERGGNFLMKELMFTQQVYGNITYLLTYTQEPLAKLWKGTNLFTEHNVSSKKSYVPFACVFKF